jgi:hypothetical protein
LYGVLGSFFQQERIFSPLFGQVIEKPSSWLRIHDGLDMRLAAGDTRLNKRSAGAR